MGFSTSQQGQQSKHPEEEADSGDEFRVGGDQGLAEVLQEVIVTHLDFYARSVHSVLGVGLDPNGPNAGFVGEEAQATMAIGSSLLERSLATWWKYFILSELCILATKLNGDHDSHFAVDLVVYSMAPSRLSAQQRQDK